MSFIGDFQVRFPCRGAAFDLSPAFQRRERRHLDLRVAERRLNEGSQEQSEKEPWSHGEIVRRLCRSTVAPRLWGIIMRIPALKRRARIKCRSAAGRSSFPKLVKSDRTIRKCFVIFPFTLLPGQIFGSGEVIAGTQQVEELTVVTTAARAYSQIAQTTANLKVVQQAIIRFPDIGLVRVSALEPLNALPRLVFTGVKNHKAISTIHLGTTDPDFFKPHPEDKYTKPFLRFKVLSAKGLPTPLILAVAVAPGGSDTLFESSLIGSVNGEIRVLTTEPLTNNVQGGIYVGNLGRGRGTGAAVWNFLWEDGAHYEPHRYEVTFYPFDVKTMSFRKGKVLSSARKHAGRGEGALSELRLPYRDLLRSIPKTEEYR